MISILAEASTSDYASSPSGYVISILVGILTLVIGFFGVQLYRRQDKTQDTLSTLNTTVEVLRVTVNTLNKTVDEIRKNR